MWLNEKNDHLIIVLADSATGEIETEIHLKDGKRHGPMREYYKSGYIEEVIFENGNAVEGFTYKRNGKKSKMSSQTMNRLTF